MRDAEHGVDHREHRDERDEHRDHVDHEHTALRRAAGNCRDQVAILTLEIEREHAAGLGLFGLRHDDLRDGDRRGTAEDRRRHEVARDSGHVAKESHVRGHDAARDGGEPSDHDAVELAHRHLGDVRSDEQRRLGLADEDVGGGRKALRAAGPHRALHHPGEHPDDALHDAEVVADRHEAREEDDAREDPERERLYRRRDHAADVGVRLALRIEDLMRLDRLEHERRAGLAERQELLHADVHHDEEEVRQLRAQHDEPERELERDAPGDRTPADRLAIDGHEPRERDHDPDAGERDQSVGERGLVRPEDREEHSPPSRERGS